VGPEDVRRHHVSAAHYLHTPISDSAVHKTLALTAACLGFPTAVVNVLDADTQHTIAGVGAVVGRTARHGTWCDEVVRTNAPLVIPDIAAATSTACTPGAYVGIPLTGREGLTVGTLCLYDVRPHPITAAELAQLQATAAIVEDQLEMLRRQDDVTSGAVVGVVELAAAVATGQVLPYYQPVVDLRTGTVVSLEALARWEHPTLGALGPPAFLGVAEDTDIITDLDLTILTQALTDLAGWLPTYPALRVNINLSARHFTTPDCVDRITTATSHAGVDPTLVTLEVTETVMFAAAHDERSHLAELREHGYRIVLDDFGTGFSTVEHVLRLPITGFKLDRAVTQALGTRVGDAVTRALVGLATDLGLSTVIEGVETPAQATTALRLGCTHAQGHLYSPALPAHQVPTYLRTGHHRGDEPSTALLQA
jgi:EAL domain-containing protein (putative c-di-GMP-specific phosphodiesterase class I)